MTVISERARASSAVLAVALTLACGGFGSSTFSVSNASVDPSYSCPEKANNARYDLNASIDVRNGTSKSVTIQQVGAVMTLSSVQGVWLQKVGDRYDAGDLTFTPSSVGPGADAKLKVTIASACTHGQGATGASYGEYAVAFTITTSAGTFKVTSKNKHRILA